MVPGDLDGHVKKLSAKRYKVLDRAALEVTSTDVVEFRWTDRCS
jgi:hypothetical protein